MLKTLVIDNGIVGLRDCFRSSPRIRYIFWEIGKPDQPRWADHDLLIVPNGTDQIAMLRLKDQVAEFLAAGKTLFCFDGWFTDWVPGNRWIMDNTRKSIDVRYRRVTDRYDLFHGVDLDAFIFSNGISGWWSCGYIEPAAGADVVLEDTWGRAIMVLDEESTPGQMFLTASGPLGDDSYATTDDPRSLDDLARFYHNLLEKLIGVRQEKIIAQT